MVAEKKKLTFTGTLQGNRKGVPVGIKAKKTQRGFIDQNLQGERE